MILDWETIQSRFNAIKDHKPRASKKLSELGEILSSAYTLSPEKADNMWQYIIELNIDNNIAFSKYYIAQVYNKLTQLLSVEDAAAFALMRPERIRLMFLHGFDGATLNHCVYTIIGYLILKNEIEQAYESLAYIKEKYLESDNECQNRFFQLFSIFSSEIYKAEISKENTFSINIVNLYKPVEQNYRYLIPVDNTISFFSNSNILDDEDVNWIARSYNILLCGVASQSNNEIINCLLFLAARQQTSLFSDLLFKAKLLLSHDEQTRVFEEFTDYMNEKSVPPYLYDYCIYYNEFDWSWVKSLVKSSCKTMQIYIDYGKVNRITESIIKDWILSDDWNPFIQFFSTGINNEKNADSCIQFIKLLMERVLNHVLSDDVVRHIIEPTVNEDMSLFIEALLRICSLSSGAFQYEDYRTNVEKFVHEMTDSYNILGKYEVRASEGYESIVMRLEEYSEKATFNAIPGKIAMSNSIIEKYFNRIRSWDKVDVFDIYSEIYKSSTILPHIFLYHVKLSRIKAELIWVFLTNERNDIAFYLFDLLVKTTSYDKYEKNGWEQEFFSTISNVLQNIITENSYWKQDHSGEWRQNNVKLNVIDNVLSIANMSLQYFKDDKVRAIKASMLTIKPESDDLTEYINGLLYDVDEYTTYLLPLGYRTDRLRIVLNSISKSFQILSKNGRIDIIAEILERIRKVKDELVGTQSYNNDFSAWIYEATWQLKNTQYSELLNRIPNVFSAWLESQPQDHDVINVATSFGNTEDRYTYLQLKQLITQKRGAIIGLEECFKHSYENSKPIPIFNSEGIQIDFYYYELLFGNYSDGPRRIGRLYCYFTIENKTEFDIDIKAENVIINGIKVCGEQTYISHIVEAIENDEFYKESILDINDFFDQNTIKRIESLEMRVEINQLYVDSPKTFISQNFAIQYIASEETFEVQFSD